MASTTSRFSAAYGPRQSLVAAPSQNRVDHPVQPGVARGRPISDGGSSG